METIVKDKIIKPQEKSFDEKFSHFSQIIKPQTSIYKTYLKLQTGNINFPPELNFKLVNKVDFPTNKGNVNNFINLGKNFFESNIKATDPYSAAIAAKSEFGTILDLIRFGVQKPIKIDVDKMCLVIQDNRGNIYQTNPVLGGFLADNINKLPKYEAQFFKILNSDRISHSSKDKLKGALRYFRLGLEGITVEHQFLNFWIALEHVVKTGKGHTSIIQSINSFIPKTLALNYNRKIILDTIELITKRSDTEIPTNIVPFINRDSLHKFIELIRDNDLFNQLIKSPNITPLIEHRLNRLRRILSDSKSIHEAIYKNCWDIEHHLARMYRYRNKIVHQAAHDLNIAGITTNLLAYLNEILIKLLYELNSDGDFTEIQEVFLKYTVTYDKFMVALNKDKSNKMDLEILIDPLRFVWPPPQKNRNKT